MITVIDSVVVKEIYQGDGATTHFPFSFPFDNPDFVKVAIYTIATEAEETLTSDYFVDTNASEVIYPGYPPGEEPPEEDQPPVLPSTQKLIVYRSTPISQLEDLGDKYPLPIIEDMVDKITMIAQELNEKLGRTLTIEMAAPYTPEEFLERFREGVATAVAKAAESATWAEGTDAQVSEFGGTHSSEGWSDVSKIWAEGTDGQVTPLGGVHSAKGWAAAAEAEKDDAHIWAEGTDAQVVPLGGTHSAKVWAQTAEKVYYTDNVAAMRADSFCTPGMFVMTKGYYSANDGGAATYNIRAAAAGDVDDGGSIIILDNSNVAELITDGTVNVRQFGAKGDGTTDDSVAIINAVNSSAHIIEFAFGTFAINDFVEFPINKTPIFSGATIKKLTNGWMYFHNPTYPILPEWFGAVGDGVTNDCAAIQSALDSIIDIRIDPIGVVANPNHGHYNSATVEFAGGKKYYIGGNTILIRSEHHFLGVELRGSSPSTYSPSIMGDVTGTLLEIEKPLNNADDGAQTCKKIVGLGFQKAQIGVKMNRSDQSNYIEKCRFDAIRDSAIYVYENDNLQIINNTFNDCGGGWLVYAVDCGLCKISGNITGESVNQTKGIYFRSGSSRANSVISDNVFRGGQIYATTLSNTLLGLVISNNTIFDGKITEGSALIEATGIYGAVIIGNVVSKSDNTSGIGILFDRGAVHNNYIYNCYDGIKSTIRGTIQGNSIVSSSHYGIFCDRGSSASIETQVFDNYINGGEVGIYVNRSYNSMVKGNMIENCTTGISGGDGYKQALTFNNGFRGCTNIESIYKPTPNREHDRVILSDMYIPEATESYKLRSGVGQIASVLGTYTAAPAGGTWKKGDIVWNQAPTAGGYAGWICVTGGTPGTWKGFGAIAS